MRQSIFLMQMHYSLKALPFQYLHFSDYLYELILSHIENHQIKVVRQP
jgi:hypothetical protein